MKVSSHAGLCCRVRQLLGFSEVCRQHGWGLTFLWVNNHHCGRHGGEFEVDGVQIVNIDTISPDVPVVPGICGFTEIVQAYDIKPSASLELGAYRRVHFCPGVASSAELAREARLAVHARTTDLPTITGVYLTAEDFIKRIEELGDEHAVFPLYLATDSHDVQSSVRRRFGDSNVITSAVLAPGCLRQSTLRDAVVDLVACTIPPLFLGTHWSGYSFVVRMLRRVRGEESVPDSSPWNEEPRNGRLSLNGDSPRTRTGP